GEAGAAGQLRARFALPLQAAGDHQVDHHEQAALEAEDEALADAAQLLNALVLACRERRLDAAEQKRAAQAHLLELAVEDPGLETLEVDGEVRVLGHG